jgi:hypothetical protein
MVLKHSGDFNHSECFHKASEKLRLITTAGLFSGLLNDCVIAQTHLCAIAQAS